MNQVTVRKQELLAKLTENRRNHRAAFEKAQEGFRVRVIEELDQHLADAKAGRNIKRHVNLPEPEDHTKDYDRIITMVEMSVDEEIELHAQDFARYVMDNWEWKDRVTSTNSMYGVQ